MPISRDLFHIWQDYETFFMHLRRELRHNGFAGIFAFYSGKEAIQPEFSDRLCRYQADTVIWFMPHRQLRETADRLIDKGIRGISIGAKGSSMFQTHYSIIREPAIHHAIAFWKGAGIRRVVIGRKDRTDSIENDLEVEAALRKIEMPYEFRELNGEESAKYISGLQQMENCAVMFSRVTLATLLGFRAPKELLSLIRTKRVLFLDGPPIIPFVGIPNYPVDLITCNWQLLAERVVGDLASNSSIKDEASMVQAKWCSRMPLNQCAQELALFPYLI